MKNLKDARKLKLNELVKNEIYFLGEFCNIKIIGKFLCIIDSPNVAVKGFVEKAAIFRNYEIEKSYRLIYDRNNNNFKRAIFY